MSYRQEIFDILASEIGHRGAKAWHYDKNRHLRDRRPVDVLDSGKPNAESLVWNAAWQRIVESMRKKQQRLTQEE